MTGYLNSIQCRRRRGTGLVRSLVVATATLAILVVCFSIYQYGQMTPEVEKPTPSPRLPSLPTPSTPAAPPEAGPPDSAAGLGQEAMGQGRKIKLTIFPREGTKARLEIAVSRWSPIQGTADEFQLIDPEVRMRTKDGRAVRVTATEGLLEARRKGGGGLDAQRGRLMGNVVIEVDRLTEQERGQLPEDRRNKIEPSQLVRIAADEIEFDLEYSKVTVPTGNLHVSAREVDFHSNDIEIQFNEEAGRVEYLRINHGGRIELHDVNDELGLSLPGTEAGSDQRSTVTQWLRSTIVTALESRKPKEADEEENPAPEVAMADDGTPIFRPDVAKEKKAEEPVRYLSRFQDRIDIRQIVAGVVQSRLEADVLNIRRAFTEEDKQQSRAQAAGNAPSQESAEETPNERIVVEWAGKLVVEACGPDDERCGDEEGLDVVAEGVPVHISGPDGDATCSEMRFDPDTSRVWLTGTETEPVVIRSADQGTLSGRMVYSEQSGSTMHTRITGPGRLLRSPEGVSVTAAEEPESAGSDLVIDFATLLDVHGRTVTRTRVDFTGGLTRRQYRIIDRAVFSRDVRLRVDETDVRTDELTVHFGTRLSGGDLDLTLDRVEARGHVVTEQGRERIKCGEMSLALSTDRNGKVIPLTMTALAAVEVTQDDRLIRCNDKLVADFTMVTRPAPPFNAVAAHAKATAAGLDITEIDWEKKRREHEASTRTEIGISRLRAYGDVNVLDPKEGLDLTSETLDCTLVEGKDIETAIIKGVEDRPATVRLEAFTVTGMDITLDVPAERADVPGYGRMTFRSMKDLDGRRLAEPIPIAVTWDEQMNYRGKENRAVFAGNVHATSATNTTFDCGRFTVEFKDAPPPAAPEKSLDDWWILEDVVARLTADRGGDGPGLAGRKLSKEVTYMLATGKAVALTSQTDPVSGKLKSRARLAGPKLSVDFRAEVSKMLIEGAGDLLLEDFRETDAATTRSTPVASAPSEGLFSIEKSEGPSKMLIQWKDYMWYDFAIDQTRFEGDVHLRYLAGAQLEKLFGGATPASGQAEGRETYLACNVLTVDFLKRSERKYGGGDQRMGRLSAERLRQFHASGQVSLQDATEGISLTAGDVVYERERDLLIVQGENGRAAHIVMQKPGEFPRETVTERFVYDLKTGRGEAVKATFRGQ